MAEQLVLDPDVLAIAITGSVARGDASPASDVDLWVLGKRNTREAFAHPGVDVTLLWQTPARARTDDSLLRFEVEDAVVLHDPGGLFLKLRSLHLKKRQALRATMIQDSAGVILDLISRARRQPPGPAVALIREAGRRSAALRIYLDFGWRVPKWRHFERHLPGQALKKLALLQSLPVHSGAWRALLRHMRAHRAELQRLQQSTRAYPPPLPSLEHIQWLSKKGARESSIISVRQSLQEISHGRTISASAEELWRIVHGFDQKKPARADVRQSAQRCAALVQALKLDAQLGSGGKLRNAMLAVSRTYSGPRRKN